MHLGQLWMPGEWKWIASVSVILSAIESRLLTSNALMISEIEAEHSSNETAFQQSSIGRSWEKRLRNKQGCDLPKSQSNVVYNRRFDFSYC